MRFFGFGFLMVSLLVSAPMAITVADTVQSVAPDNSQSLPQPNPDEDLMNLQD